MAPREIYYENLANTVIKNMKVRQIDACYCRTKEDAVIEVSSTLLSGSTVSYGGSMTLFESGVMDLLKRRTDISLLDRSTAKTPEEKKEIYRKAFSCNYYFMSCNAITKDGLLYNTDGTGNRTAALIYGPDHVIILAGMNKIVADEASALSRIHNTVAPMNCNRLERNTPCSITGICGDCLSPDCICSNTVITRRNPVKGRIKVILIGEELGY